MVRQGQAPQPATDDTLLCLSVDGKGMVMRPEALHAETRKAAAAKGANTYHTRLASGEKQGRKRMATREGARAVAQLLDQHPDAKVRVAVVWTSRLLGDARDQCDPDLLADARVTHWWDQSNDVARSGAPVIDSFDRLTSALQALL